jgi:serine/threonine protein kinase
MKYCTVCKAKYDDSVSFCPVDGEVLDDDPSSIVGTVLDSQYQMEALLGKGGMGAVYSARHILLGDRVAIKVLPPEVRTNAEWLRRFRREGQAARRFRHANAVTVYDLRTSGDGTIYMVMEYVEGHTLDAELKKRGRLTASEAFELLAPIMSVLDTAHAMGVVHRDLKPENIMVGKPDGNGAPIIKLLDLGIAKMREIAGVDSGGNTALTMAGQVLGTPYYMSPEQWGEIPRDESLEIDGRADIYSLGLVFYEMIVGRRCFSGNTLHELRREHVAIAPRPLREVVPDVPRGFSDAIERATAKDRGDRQPTAAALASELRAGLQSASSGNIASTNAAPHPADLAETMALPDNANTNSDVNAPTIIGLDGASTALPIERPAATSAPPVIQTPNSAPVVNSEPEPSMTAATMVESAPLPSSVTIAQLPKAEVPHRPAKGKSGLVIVAGIVIVLLVMAGIGGFLIFNRLKSPPATRSGTVDAVSNANAVAPREVTRYWLELEPKSAKDKPSRVAGLVPIASGQALKMHFVFTDDGYVYIIGPGGNNNQPTAFLTAKPIPGSGLKNNKVNGGVELSFPSGPGNLTLDRNPGTDVFTVIFSKSPLSSPSFLNAPVTFDPLSQTQQAELKEFVTKYQEKRSTAELDELNSQAPFVRVKVTPTQTDNPIVFDIRIQHN